MKLLLIALFAASAYADTPPVPKIFKGMQGQKGQYQVDMLEGLSGKSMPQKMTVCTDNLMNQRAEAKARRSGESSCKYKLLKDTADEAVIETTCDNRTSKVTVTRESAKSMLMTMESSGPKGPRTVKMRYTYLGACREGQGAVSLDPNSEQCQKIKAQAAQVDPAKHCAKAGDNRAQCEQQMRDMRDRMTAMCK